MFAGFRFVSRTPQEYILLNVEGQERQVQDKSNPVTVDEEQGGQESVDGGFGFDVGVEAVAQVDRVDVVALKIRVPVDGPESAHDTLSS